MKQEFEQTIRDRLGDIPASELGWEYDKEVMWQRINDKQRRRLILFRPVFTHAAAAVAGILLAGSIMLFIFRKSHTERPIPAQPNITLKNKPVKQYPEVVVAKEKNKTAPQTAVAALDNKQTSARGTGNKKPLFIQNRTASTDRAVSTPQPAEEIAVTKAVPEKEQHGVQRPVAKKKPVIYWVDVRKNYEQPVEKSGVWADINKRLEHLNDYPVDSPYKEIPPAVAFINAFK